MPFTFPRGKRYWRQFHQWPFELNDQFTTPHAAVFPSPQLCEPGPGSWLVTDLDARMSIPAGGGLLYAAGSNNWDRCMLVCTTPFAKKAGRYCEFEFTPTSLFDYLRAGWNFAITSAALGTGATGSIQNNEATIYFTGAGVVDVTDGLDVVAPQYPLTLGTSYTSRIYDTGSGWLYYIRQTSVPDSWTLLWERTTSFPRVPHFSAHYNNHGQPGSSTHLFVRQGLIKPPIAAQTLPGAGEILPGAADAIFEAEIQAPATGTRNLLFRYSNASNYWYVQVNNTNQTMQLHKVVAGVDTPVALTSVLWGTGAFTRIRAVCFANHIRTFYGIQAGPLTDDTFNQTALLFGTDTTAALSNGQPTVINLLCQTGGKLRLN